MHKHVRSCTANAVFKSLLNKVIRIQAFETPDAFMSCSIVV